MYLVAGLGNPGRKYARNRHNVGFMVADLLAERLRTGELREKFKGLYGKGSLGAEEVIVLKPMTYMNVSGESVQKALAFFKLPLDRLLVIHDELDLSYRTLRLKVGGGLAGHNGLRSIAELCGGNDFLRLRIGIGRPPGAMSTEGWVLSDFDPVDAAELPGVIGRAAEMVERALVAGPETAMREFHRKEKEEPPPP